MLVTKIQQAIEDYDRIFVVELINQRNQELKDIRADLDDSKYVFTLNDFSSPSTV